MISYDEFNSEFELKIRVTFKHADCNWVEHIKSKLHSLSTECLQYMLTAESMHFSFWSEDVLDEVKCTLDFRLNISLEDAIRGFRE